MKSLLSFLVVAFLVVIFSFGCKKKSTPIPKYAPPPGSQYTSQMGGVRVWTGSKDYSGCYLVGNGLRDTSYGQSVTVTDSVKIINDTTIFVLGGAQPLMSFDSVGKALIFGGVNYAAAFGSSSRIIYYYLSDYMVYDMADNEGACYFLTMHLSTQ